MPQNLRDFLFTWRRWWGGIALLAMVIAGWMPIDTAILLSLLLCVDTITINRPR